jgi:hypothetical protein
VSVYFIRAEGSGLVKIGFAVDPWIRLNKLKTDCPWPVVMAAIIEGGVDREREMHDRFAALRSRGEWFRDEGALSAYIAENATEPRLRKQKALGGVLGRWLSENHRTLESFAQEIGTNKSSVSGFCNGRSIPRRRLMLAIYEATDGAVQPNDFYGIESAAEAA